MEYIATLLVYLKALLVAATLSVELLSAQGYQLLSMFAQDISTTLKTHTLPEPYTPAHNTATTTAPKSKPATNATTTSTTTATTTAVKPVKKSVATSTPAKVVAAAAQTPTTPLTPLLDPELVNTNTRQSIVNILCVVQGGGSVRSISGSGVIIDSRGIVLTNAHVGQYFLLTDYPTKGATDCVIRTGSPATPLYRATLLYLPSAWIDENASQIVSEQSIGTGEHDYAFLKITETTNPSGTLPSSFKNIAMSVVPPNTGDQTLVAGYPAGFLDGITIEKSLFATSAFTTIGQLYTFNEARNVDVVSVGGTVVAQGGSSGGAVVRTYDGQLVGLIATATAGETTSSRDLRAITIGYINRALATDGKGGLVELLSGDLDKVISDFAPTYSLERQKLIQTIEHR